MKKAGLLFALVFTLLIDRSFSQADSTKSINSDSTKKEFYLKGSVTVTNKGISYIPNFSLGKPAALFDVSMGNGKLSFEPQLRFSLVGEPWAFLFPVRYKINPTGKFQVIAGLNPLMNFKTLTYSVNGVSKTELVNRRYLGGEFRPTYFFTKNISIGVTYLYFRGVSNGALKNTHFVSVNTNFSEIKFGSKFFARINAQCYYLDQDGFWGWYFNPVLTLLRRKFPLSLQSILNATIVSNIPGNEDPILNISLIYAFNRVYVRK